MGTIYIMDSLSNSPGFAESREKRGKVLSRELLLLKIGSFGSKKTENLSPDFREAGKKQMPQCV